MKHVLVSLAITALAAFAPPALAQEADPTAGVVAGPEASAELIRTIRARDAELFALVFDTCNAEGLRPLIAREFEFVHDKWGTTARTAEEFISSIRQMCERRASGEDVRASRELVEDSLRVYAVQDNAAIEIGEHRFYGLAEGRPPHLRETGRFFMHWVLEDGAWKLRRVYSYDHRPAE
jgi:hypothetical protein